MIRATIVTIFLALYTLVLGLPLILCSFLTGSVDLLYRVSLAAVLFIMRAVGVRVRVEGLENVPPGVCLFVANHSSNADPPAVVGAIPRRISILAKDSLFRIPLVSWAFRLASFVPVNRTNREAAVARDRKSTRLNSSHANISYAVFCLKKKSNETT